MQYNLQKNIQTHLLLTVLIFPFSSMYHNGVSHAKGGGGAEQEPEELINQLGDWLPKVLTTSRFCTDKGIT